MKIPSDMPRLKGFRYPREIIAYAVWVYHRFALSTTDVEGLLAERGLIVSRETVRLWVNRFGHHFAHCIRRDRPRPNGKWHLDEVVITISGKKHWLWRAIDAAGDVLDILVQTRRNAKAAKRFVRRLIVQFGEPRVVITDKLRSYIKPIHTLAAQADHRAHKGLNNDIEVSHRPTRKREKIFGRFKSHRQAQRCRAWHGVDVYDGLYGVVPTINDHAQAGGKTPFAVCFHRYCHSWDHTDRISFQRHRTFACLERT